MPLRSSCALVSALLLVGAAVAPAHAQKNAEVADTARFRFAWPDSIDARVSLTHFRVRNAETVDTTFTSLSYRMRVRPHAEGRVVSYTDFGFGGDSRGPEGDMFQEMVASMVPTVVIDRGGQFVRVANLDDLQRSLDAIWDAIPDSTGEVRAAIDRVMTPQLLTALSAQQWNSQIGYWVGADLEIGALYQMEEDVELPMLPGSRVPMVSDIAVYDRVDCVEGSGALDCVEAGVRSYPEPEAVAAAIETFLQSFDPDEPLPFRIDSIDMETEVTLVADPDSMLPYWYRESRHVTGTGGDATESGTFGQIDIKTYEYTYD